MPTAAELLRDVRHADARMLGAQGDADNAALHLLKDERHQTPLHHADDVYHILGILQPQTHGLLGGKGHGVINHPTAEQGLHVGEHLRLHPQSGGRLLLVQAAVDLLHVHPALDQACDGTHYLRRGGGILEGAGIRADGHIQSVGHSGGDGNTQSREEAEEDEARGGGIRLNDVDVAVALIRSVVVDVDLERGSREKLLGGLPQALPSPAIQAHQNLHVGGQGLRQRLHQLRPLQKGIAGGHGVRIPNIYALAQGFEGQRKGQGAADGVPVRAHMRDDAKAVVTVQALGKLRVHGVCINHAAIKHERRDKIKRNVCQFGSGFPALQASIDVTEQAGHGGIQQAHNVIEVRCIAVVGIRHLTAGFAGGKPAGHRHDAGLLLGGGGQGKQVGAVLLILRNDEVEACEVLAAELAGAVSAVHEPGALQSRQHAGIRPLPDVVGRRTAGIHLHPMLPRPVQMGAADHLRRRGAADVTETDEQDAERTG